MTDARRESLEQRVLVLAPTGKDAHLTQTILGRAGVACASCTDLDQVCEELERGSGVLLVAEEAVQTRHARLAIWLGRQPPWSDLPVLVLARRGAESATVGRAMDLLGNVTVLERPIRVSAFVSSVRTALRARQRQYEAREHLSQIERSERDLHLIVSELRQSQSTLEVSEQRFRNIFQNAGVSLWEEDFSGVREAIDGLRSQGVTDFDRYFKAHPEFVQQVMGAIRVLDVNDTTVAMFEARDKSELLGSLPKIFVPESIPVFVDELKAVAAGQPYFEAEALLSTVRGNPMHVYFTMVLPAPGQSYDRVLFSVIDITGRKRAEDLLKQADRRKDEFLAILAHELRNPLAPIRNSLHILRLTAPRVPSIERIAEMMERQVNLMVRLVDDLLEVSRITRGKIELRKERVEVAAVVRSAVETSRPHIRTGGHRLVLGLPSEPLVLEGDPVRLAQILANLLNNAAKYTERGGRIDLSVRRELSGVAISVRDTGAGIPPEMLPRIFDLFTQVDSGKAKGGLGIGLTLVKNLTEMHGGSVTAHSDGLGQGSEFLVRLPLAADRSLAGAPLSLESPGVISAPRRVMVVDDNRDAAESLAALLKLLGADTHVEYGGPQALEALASYRPDVLLLDIGMPDMNGYELARRIRQRPEFENAILIALTGWGQENDQRRSEMAGFDYHLIKPADIGALQAVLDSTEGRRRGWMPRLAASTGEASKAEISKADAPAKIEVSKAKPEGASGLPRSPAS